MYSFLLIFLNKGFFFLFFFYKITLIFIKVLHLFAKVKCILAKVERLFARDSRKLAKFMRLFAKVSSFCCSGEIRKSWAFIGKIYDFTLEKKYAQWALVSCDRKN